MEKIYPAQKINLVERPEWAPYDPTDRLESTIIDAIDGSLRWIEEDKYYLADTAELFLSMPPKRKRVYLSDEDGDLLQAAFTQNDPRLERFSDFIRTAVQFAWEEAFIPTIDDIRSALADTIVDLNDTSHYRLIKGDLYDVFVQDPNRTGPQLMAYIFNVDTISPYHKPGYYDRFIIYDPASSPFIRKLLTERIRRLGPGVLDWSPPIEHPDPELVQDLVEIFDDYKRELIPYFFKVLANQMKDVDYQNRSDIRKTVLRLIAEKGQDVKDVRDELRRFFEGPEEASLGANPFMSPRTRRLMKDIEEMKQLAEESSILEFEAFGDPPERYLLTFHGLGLTDQGLRDTHKIEINLGIDYPRQLPQIAWQTPILHPNISGRTPCLGGFLMNPRVRLVDIVELLWDMNRMEILNPYGGYGQAENWLKLRNQYGFPVDKRILRDRIPRVEEPEKGDDDVDLIILGR